MLSNRGYSIPAQIIVLLSAFFFSPPKTQASPLSGIASYCSYLISTYTAHPFEPDVHRKHHTYFSANSSPRNQFPFEYFASIPQEEQIPALLAWADYHQSVYDLTFLSQLEDLGDRYIRFRYRNRKLYNFEASRSKIVLDLPPGPPTSPEDVIKRLMTISRTLSEFRLNRQEQSGLFLPYARRAHQYENRLLKEAALADLRLFSLGLQLERTFPSDAKAQKALREFWDSSSENPETKMTPGAYLAALFGFDFQVMRNYRFTADGFERSRTYFSLGSRGKQRETIDRYQEHEVGPKLSPALQRKLRQRQVGVSRLLGFPSTGVLAVIVGTTQYYLDPLRGFDPSVSAKDPLELIVEGTNEYDLDVPKIKAYLQERGSELNHMDRERLIELIGLYELELSKSPPNTVQRTLIAAEVLMLLDKHLP